MAHKYKILSGVAVAGLFGIGAYSIASGGNHDKAFFLSGNVIAPLMSEEFEEVDEIEEDEEDEDSEDAEEEVVETLEENAPDASAPTSSVEITESIETSEAVEVSEPLAPPTAEESQLSPEPSTEGNKAAEAPKPEVQEKKEESNPTTTPSIEAKPQPAVPPKPVANPTSSIEPAPKPQKSKKTETSKPQAKKAKGKKPKKPSNGKDVSGAPRSVSANRELSKQYTAYNHVGKAWGNDLLDPSNAAWWIVNEKYLLDYEDGRFKTEDFRKLHQELKAKSESDLNGQTLMEWCKSKYTHIYQSQDDPAADDIWIGCRMRDNGSTATTKARSSATKAKT